MRKKWKLMCRERNERSKITERYKEGRNGGVFPLLPLILKAPPQSKHKSSMGVPSPGGFHATTGVWTATHTWRTVRDT